MNKFKNCKDSIPNINSNLNKKLISPISKNPLNHTLPLTPSSNELHFMKSTTHDLF